MAKSPGINKYKYGIIKRRKLGDFKGFDELHFESETIYLCDKCMNKYKNNKKWRDKFNNAMDL